MTTAEKIIQELLDRAKFDHWWDPIDRDIKREIIAEIDGIIAKDQK